MKVKVYYNLHRNLFSIQYKNKVLGYCDRILLKDVSFKVNQAGRKRVLVEQRKNVHAYVIGDIVAIENDGAFELRTSNSTSNPQDQLNLVCYLQDDIVKSSEKEHLEKANYNPYKCGYFYRENDGAQIHSSSKCLLDRKTIWITN